MSVSPNINVVYNAVVRKSIPTITLLVFCFATSFGQIDVLADDQFTFTKDNADISLPYYSTESIHQEKEEITKVIIVVHGTNRNADDYFANMKTALRQRPDEVSKTLIVAPQFLVEMILINFDQVILLPTGVRMDGRSEQLLKMKMPIKEILEFLLTKFLIR